MNVSALILAGGMGSRMGGKDKGMLMLDGLPMVEHVIQHIAPQVDEIIINANRHLAEYQRLGYPVYQDAQPDFIGPLAGFYIGMAHAKHDFLLVLPCDSPAPPRNLVHQLQQGLVQANADVAVAQSAGENHPVFCLCKTALLPSLTDYIAQGGRKVSAWQKSHAYIEVPFEDSSGFVNINTPSDLQAFTTTPAVLP